MNGYTRADWLERASELLPTASDAEREHAADLLALWYDDPTVTYDAYGPTLPAWQYAPGKVTPSAEATDPRDVKPQTVGAPYMTGLTFPNPRARDGVRGGGVPNFSDAPDAWAGLKHSMGANIAGVQVVKRRGNARVQGTGRSIDDLPNGASPALLCQMLDDLPRNSVGAIGWQVTALTDLFYGDSIPALLGNDAKTAGEHTPAGVDLATVRGIVHASDDRGRMSWPLRTHLRSIRVRKSERAIVGSCLVAPHTSPDRMWVGHRCVQRGKLQRTTRGRIKARTIDLGAVTIDTAAGLATVAEAMNRDERATVRYAGLSVTITRGKGTAGTYSATVPGRGKVNGIRTPANLVKRVTELVAAS